MPKIIENLRETLLAASRTLLLEEGYRALTMRQVAGLCHVAVGTVYNYFPSKDMLAAHILLEDWNDLLRSLQKKVNATPAPMDGLEAVFSGLRAFSRRYRPVWEEYDGSAALPFRQWHGRLIEQLAACMEPLLRRFDLLFAPIFPKFLAQALLSWSLEEDTEFSALRPVLDRLLQPYTNQGGYRL